jgi:flavorubredoxin
METRIDQIVGGIYRISTMTAPYGITFNQFLIDDERPALIHTGEYESYESIRRAIREVLDPARLELVTLLHWEGDENGGMDRFLTEARGAQLVGSDLSIALNAKGFGVPHRTLGMRDGDTLDLGRHRLRFLETPHVHHWDSMMVFEETTQSLFPSDLFLQPGDQPPVVREDLADGMLEVYRRIGIFAHEDPVRRVVDRIDALDPAWTHAMHGGSLPRETLGSYVDALREEPFGYQGLLMGRELDVAVA